MSRRSQIISAAPRSAPPSDPEVLRARLVERHSRMSSRLQQIARFALGHPHDMALETVAVIAERAQVQPSAVVRFAQSFGFAGFSEMQRVYQSDLLESVSSYTDRLHRALSISGEKPPNDPGTILQEFIAANTASLQRLGDALHSDILLRAVTMLREARVVHVMGVRRSFPVATYLGYALNHAGCKAHLVTGLAGLSSEQMQLMESEDVLIAISAHPYAPGTCSVAEAASHYNVPIIAMTDSLVSPLATVYYTDLSRTATHSR